MKSTKVLTARNAQKYENEVAIELPIPRYSNGKSSPTSNHEIGDIPIFYINSHQDLSNELFDYVILFLKRTHQEKMLL